MRFAEQFTCKPFTCITESFSADDESFAMEVRDLYYILSWFKFIHRNIGIIIQHMGYQTVALCQL